MRILQTEALLSVENNHLLWLNLHNLGEGVFKRPAKFLFAHLP